MTAAILDGDFSVNLSPLSVHLRWLASGLLIFVGLSLGEAAALALQQQAGFDLSATLGALFAHGAVIAVDHPFGT